MMKFYFILFCLAVTAIIDAIEAREELVVIQAVSSTKKTLVLNRGFADGIGLYTESLFSTQDVSLAARAIEVAHNYSLWELNDKNAIFPFEKEQLVTFNQNQTNIWNEIPEVKNRLSGAVLTQDNFVRHDSPKHTFGPRISLSNTFYESISETDSERKPQRTGLTVEGFYYLRYSPRIELGFGLRLDQEEAVITDPDLTIPSRRVFGLTELTYHFEPIRRSGNNFFVTLGAGIGQSQTEVDESISTGMATLLPYARAGYLMRRGQRTAFVIEGTVEAISTNESFLDTKEQTTNLVNARIGLGLRF
jgi:hypothetical protein